MSNKGDRPTSAESMQISPCASQHMSLPLVFFGPVPLWATQLPPSLALLLLLLFRPEDGRAVVLA